MNHRAYRAGALIFYRGFKKNEKNCLLFALGKGSIFVLRSPGGGGGTPLYGLYGDMPLDRVWFLAPLS